MKYLLTLLFWYLFISILFSQSSDLFIPLDVQRAYDNGTRSYDGTVGNNYWINHTDYNIDVEFFPDSNMIVGSEEIIYHNESPDSLKVIIIRLYQNITKPGVVRNWSLPEYALTNGVAISKLRIQNNLIDLESNAVSISGTNMSVKLQNKLQPFLANELFLRFLVLQ